MNREQFIRILRRYRKGDATGEEKRFIETYYALFEGEPDLEAWIKGEDGQQAGEAMLERIWERVSREKPSSVTRGRRKISSRLVKVAAAVILLLASSLVVYKIRTTDPRGHKMAVETAPRGDEDSIMPGGNHAVLTLANGKKVVLDSVENGSLGKQGNTRIIKVSSSLLSYDNPGSGRQKVPAGKGRPPAVAYNTISTPKGGIYQVVLPDGSKVWLNAASSLHFPVAFSGDTREVTVSGEAYFEVAARPRQPFIVHAGKLRVEVLGTHFNIEAYGDEKRIRTTLATGSVRMAEGDQGILLKPGEQGTMDEETRRFRAVKVNVDKALAWKNNLFYFDDTNIKDIMREIARWYDVSVVYETKNLDNKNYSGIMSRYSDVSAVLKRMELTGTVHFKVTGRMITVMN